MRQTLHKMATKPLLLAVCLGLALLMATAARAQGRAPAVLNERGISIEERKQIPPQEAREFGFNFKETKNQPSIATPPIAQGAERETSTTLVIFAVVILAMPLFLWFGLMRQLKRQRAEMISNAPVSLDEFRARQGAKKTEVKPDKFPKAS